MVQSDILAITISMAIELEVEEIESKHLKENGFRTQGIVNVNKTMQENAVEQMRKGLTGSRNKGKELLNLESSKSLVQMKS